MAQPILGIDLGTTYSAVAIIDEFQQPKVLPNRDSELTTPSVVYFESADSVIVGKEAKRVAKVAPDDVAIHVKRLMGERADYEFSGVQHYPESISALILKQIARDAFESLGIEPVEPIQAIVTVPAYFGIKEKEATKNAGVIAGLDVITLLPEPVAAALTYGVRYGDESRTVFVYDLGGGTFDTTILEVKPKKLEVVAIDGKRDLGGADLDQALLDFAIAEFKDKATPDLDPEEDDQFIQSLSLDVEEAKRSLSVKQSTTLAMTYGGASHRLVLTREKLEELIAPMIETTMQIVERTMEAARDKKPDLRIDEVLLVGGSSKIPMVARLLEDQLGARPVVADPDLAVAKGAAIYSSFDLDETPEPAPEPTPGETPFITGRTEGAGRGSTDRVSNVLPRAFGVMVWDEHLSREQVHWLVSANATLPVPTINQRFSVAQDNTTAIVIQLFEQKGERVSNDPEHCTNVTPDQGALITDLPRLRKGDPIEIEMDIDHQGLAHIRAFEPTTGQRLTIPVQIDGLEQRVVEEMTERVSGIRLGD